MHVVPMLGNSDVNPTSIPAGKTPEQLAVGAAVRGATSLLHAATAHSMQHEWLPPGQHFSIGHVHGTAMSTSPDARSKDCTIAVGHP